MRSLFAIALAVFAAPAFAADWTQFKGPNGSGVSSEKDLPNGFTAKDGLRWKVPLPARGLSSPVVFGNKVFVTCSGGTRDDRLTLLAFDTATGEPLWQRGIGATGSTTAHPKTCMAAPTPVVDETGVYALFATGDLLACDLDGGLLWIRSLTGDYPSISNQLGLASSPVLFKDKLIVPMDNSGESFLAALDTKTGKNVWKTERPRDINWVTPVIREITSSEVEVLYQSAKDLVAYNLADGKKKWSHKAASSTPTPTLVDGLLLTSTDGLTVLKATGENKLEEVWKSAKYRTGYTSALYYDGKVYAAIPSTGFVYCIDAKTGKSIWDERVPGKGKQTFSGSPAAGDGKVYVVTESGTLAVFKAGGESAELTISEVGEELLATPAISGGAVFLRSDKSLLCIGAKAKK